MDGGSAAPTRQRSLRHAARTAGAEEPARAGRWARPCAWRARSATAGRPRPNGAPAGNGSASGIADFDQIATSVQELFRFLDGPTAAAVRGGPPQLAAEEIAHRFQVDLAAILLDNAGEVQTMGSVGLRAGRTSSTDRGGLVTSSRRRRAAGPGWSTPTSSSGLPARASEADQADSLALVAAGPRRRSGSGSWSTGRRRTDERVAPAQRATRCRRSRTATCDMVPVPVGMAAAAASSSCG